ncbi:hypothetical protein [Haloplanus aerogenes]|uniref:Uncharacterized protein n=1 Tax=Haloplanus aerogenes TaxID=660522 RepID=A0A3M0CHL9_9EURY|nr:hypothetical protein [Haloplanus aerogenes]AZH24788.1 hypothetical protein DU502_05085 [Haloplanus aerogenes]RMB08325.1 hypothetical protein ATH50_3540 [Haloplanus aerogenes]
MIIAECPNLNETPEEHLRIKGDYETSVDDDVLDDLVEAWPGCGKCGADLYVLDFQEPTEVIE